ncbi:MAG: hypothetical protein JST75_06905 [Bacteroidetes bacterium]|nr:hypothetical protein [Bacteroidota bacterium]
MDKKTQRLSENKKGKEEFPGYPHYPEKDDIYNKEKEEHLNEDGSMIEANQKTEKILGDDLDVPGAELDDADEILGEEDEENNYYSLGGDDHDDLEEDRS